MCHALKQLRRKFETFLYKNRDRGVSNLMLYIAIGNLAVFFITMIDPSQSVYRWLYFDRTAILHGQVMISCKVISAISTEISYNHSD